MRNLKDIILEKLKVSTNTESVSFTFNELRDSMLRFVNKNLYNANAVQIGTEHIVRFYKIDYFKDNPLIVTNDASIGSKFRLQGCKIGTMCLNTKTPDYITCHTTGRSLTLKDKFEVDKSFEITSENYNKVFNTDNLEKLYEILNEEN